MSTNRWRGDAPAKSKILRLLEPVTAADAAIHIVVTIGNKTATFDAWNPTAIVADLQSRGWAELTGITLSVAGSDILATGTLDADFDIGLAVSPTVFTAFTQAVPPANQVTRLNFGGATSGTFRLTCNGEQTAAITLFTGSSIDVAAIESAIAALSSFAAADVEATVSGGDVLVEWKGSFAAVPVSVVIDATELDSGGELIISEIQPARPAAHDIWFMGSDADFEYDISDGTTAVTLKTNASDEDMSNKLSAAWGGEVEVVSTLVSGTPVSRRFYILNMKGFPGTSTTLTASSISPTISPVGIGLEKIASATDTKPSEIWLVDVRDGSLEVTLGNTTISDWSSPSAVFTALVTETQFTEWNHNAQISNANLDGLLASTDLWLLRYQGDGPRIGGTLGGLADANDGGQNFDESTMVVTAEDGAAFRVLQQGGPTNAADSAIHSIHSAPKNDGSNTIAGTYKLLFPEGETASITVGASAAAVQTIINNATGVTVAVTGDGDAASPYLVDYTGDTNARALPTESEKLITGDGAGTATVDRSANAGRDARQSVTVSPQADGGTFDLRLGNEGPVSFDHDESAAAFLTKLQTFDAFSTSGDVTVTLNAGLGEYTLAFANNLDKTPVDELIVTANALTDSTASNDTRAIDQFPSGPGNWSDPLNWTLSAVPKSGDTIVLDSANDPILYGYRQFVKTTINTTTDVFTAPDGHDLINGQVVKWVFGSVAPTGISGSTDYYVKNSNRLDGTFQLSTTDGGAAIDVTAAGTGPHYCGVIADDILIPATFTQSIGLERRNEDGYDEYRVRALQIATPSTGEIVIGDGDGAGSGLMRIDTGNSIGQITVHETGAPQSTVESAFVWDCLSDSVNLLMHGGDVSVATYEDETAKFGSCNVSAGNLFLGSVTAAGNVIAASGTLRTRRLSCAGLVNIRE